MNWGNRRETDKDLSLWIDVDSKQIYIWNECLWLLAHDRWFSPGTPASSSTTKTGRYDIAEILLKVALNTINQIKSVKLKRVYTGLHTET